MGIFDYWKRKKEAKLLAKKQEVESLMKKETDKGSCIDFRELYNSLIRSGDAEKQIFFIELFCENEPFWNGKLYKGDDRIFYSNGGRINSGDLSFALSSELMEFGKTTVNPFVKLIREYASKKSKGDYIYPNIYDIFHNYCCSLKENEIIESYIYKNIKILSDPSTWKLEEKEFKSLLASLAAKGN